MDLWSSARQKWTVWVSTEHDTVHTLLSFSGTCHRGNITHTVAPPWLKKKFTLFLQGEISRRIAMFLQLKTKPLIEYSAITATIFPPPSPRAMLCGKFMVWKEDKYESTYVHKWVVSQVSDTEFWLISIQSLQLKTLSFKAQHRVLSSSMRYITVPQWWAQLPELTFPQKFTVMGHQSLDPGVHLEQHNLTKYLFQTMNPSFPLQKAVGTPQQHRFALARLEIISFPGYFHQVIHNIFSILTGQLNNVQNTYCTVICGVTVSLCCFG